MMKPWGAVVAACVLCTALVSPGQAAAAERPIRVYLDNKLIKFEVDPILDNGTTLVPFRAIFEKLGLEVGWDGETQTVTGTKEGLAIQLAIDETEALVNDRQSVLELAPRLIEGNTLVPLRFVSEASGKEVTWNQSIRTIHLKSPSVPKGTSNNGGGAKEPAKPDDETDPTKPVRGDYVYPDGSKYTGQLVGGSPEGKGKLTDAGGRLLFDGTMKDGLPSDGRSKTYHGTGRVDFDGLIKDGVASGAGKQYASDGDLLFDGTFANGEREKGTLSYDNGDKYTGPFDNNVPSGVGKLQYSNGDVYEGDFVNGRREGTGTFKTASGEKVVGDFKDNMMNGIISHYDKKGTLLSVSEYANDVLIRKVDMGNGSSTLPSTNPSSLTDPVRKENDRHQKALSEIRERYNQDKKLLEDQISQIRKEQPGTYSSLADYEKAIEKAEVKEKEIRDKLKQLPGDGSNAAVAARAELDKQWQDAQAALEKLYAKGAAQQRIDSLKEDIGELRERFNDDIKDENDRHNHTIQQLK